MAKYTLAQAPEFGRGTPDIIHHPGPFGYLYNAKGESVKDSSGKQVQIRFGKDGGVRLPSAMAGGSGGLFMLIPITPSSMARDDVQTQGFNPAALPEGQALPFGQQSQGLGGTAAETVQGGMQAEPEQGMSADVVADPVIVEGRATGPGGQGLIENDPADVNAQAQGSISRALNRPGRQ